MNDKSPLSSAFKFPALFCPSKALIKQDARYRVGLSAPRLGYFAFAMVCNQSCHDCALGFDTPQAASAV